MKKSHLLVVVAIVVLCGGAWLSSSLAQDKPAAASAGPAAKTCVCDIVSLFRNYQRAKDLTQKLTDRLQNIKSETEARTKAIDKINATLTELKPDSKEYDDRLNEVTKLTLERDAYLAFQKDLSERENYRLTKDMYEEITAMIGKVAKDTGYQLVLFREPAETLGKNLDELMQMMARRKVLYADESIDITNAVLQRLNEEYKAKK